MKILINVYVLICIMLFLFDIVFILLKNINKDTVSSENVEIRKKLVLEINNYNAEKGIDDRFKKELSKKIEKTKNLIAIIDYIQESKDSIPEEILVYLRELIFDKKNIYIKKKEMEKAYFPFVLSIFDYSDIELTISEKKDIIDFLDCKSIYTFANTMDLVYKVCDIELLEMALEKLNTTDIFYHKKLLVDGLMKYNGDKKELKESIEKNFYSYNDTIQEALIEFSRMKKINIDDLCMSILKKEKNIYLEVRYSAMRYFINVSTDESKDYFIDILNRDDSYWTEKMLVIRILEKYNDENIYKIIKEYATDKNWHIRNEAIKYIHNKNVSKEELLSILNKHDRYTNEELLYEYRNEEDTLEYIKNIIKDNELNKFESKEI